MRKLLFYFILIPTILLGQSVITDPEFPTENEPVEITFDITKMSNTSLVGYTGTLYAHTGVYTNLNNSQWQYVIESWGNNSTQPSLTRIGSDLYQLYIENPRDFYGLTNPAENIISLNIVLRSSDANSKTEDLFIQIFNEGINVKILSPNKFPLYPLEGELINLHIVTTGADSQKIFLNNELIIQSDQDTLQYSITASGNGRQWIKVVAYGSDEIYSDSSYFYTRNNITIEELPSGTRPGININNDNTITVALYAPDKEFVYLIGDFNNWEFDPVESENWEFDQLYYLKLTPDSTIYWTTLTDLTPNQEYGFQYLVDGYLRIADPYTQKILDPWNDKWISNNIYPNLKEYPQDKTSEIVSVFEIGKQEYNWQVENFEKPEKERLIIYEMWLRNFLEEHTYSTLIDTLSYLENLGINAIELMPNNEFEGNESWGYNPSFYFAADKFYGPATDLKRFVDECHKRGIAVIMDMVLNHSYGQSPLVRLYAEKGTVMPNNPWYNVTAPHTDFSWGYDFNHQSLQTQYFIDRISEHWITNYKIDGFRYDFTGGFTNGTSSGGYDQNRIGVLQRMADEIWAIDSTFYVILEHWTSDSEKKILADYGMMVWENSTHSINEATMGWNENNKSNFSSISYKTRGYNKPHIIAYMGSHDEERNMNKNLRYGNSTNPQHNVKDTTIALERVKTAAAFVFLIPGPKMLFQFEELGMDYSINWPSGSNDDRLTLKPFIWDSYYQNEERQKLYKTFKYLFKLKTDYEAFSTSNYSTSLASAVKQMTLLHQTMDVIVVGNFDVNKQITSLSLTKDGTWYNYFTGDSLKVTDPQIEIELKPSEFRIYTTKKLPLPEQGILTDINTTEIKIPDRYELLQNYPNPFNPATNIRYSIPQTAINSIKLQSVILKIYDVLGREVKTLVNENQNPGSYTINFDAGNLSSGIYFYSLSTGNFTESKKMILLR